MADFKHTCRKCFQERGQTILMKNIEGKFVCPVNPEHKFVDDIKVA